MMDAIFIHNGKTDTISPAIVMTNITCIIADMLQNNVLYVKKNGMSPAAKNSRDNLLRLLDITETFNKIACDNANLKTYNNQLLREIQALRNYKNEIIRQENISKTI